MGIADGNREPNGVKDEAFLPNFDSFWEMPWNRPFLHPVASYIAVHDMSPVGFTLSTLSRHSELA